MNKIKEIIKTILFVVAVISILVIVNKLIEEEPHTVTINGKEYMRMTEWNGNHYQIIMIPIDSISK